MKLGENTAITGPSRGLTEKKVYVAIAECDLAALGRSRAGVRLRLGHVPRSSKCWLGAI